MRRTQLEHHLLLRPKVQRLHLPALPQVPHVQLMPVLPREEELRVHPCLHHRRRAPLAGQHGVPAEVPGEVVGQMLLPAIDLPAAQDVETLMVKQKDPARAFAVRCAEGAEVDTVRATVHRMRAAVPRAARKLIRLDDLYEPRVRRVRLCVQDVDA